MNIQLNIPDANAPDIVDGICAATGWTPRVSLREAVAETLDYYRRHLKEYIQ